jgi:transposase
LIEARVADSVLLGAGDSVDDGRASGEREALFYGFSLERRVPDDHLLRKIDRFVDLSEVRAHLGPYYSEVGRPSIDPELMIRMLIVGYGFGIRSERWLCEEVHLNLAYRWFCRLGPDADVSDHSTFSKNRHGRFRNSDLLRKLFETVAARCMEEGIVGGEAFAVDASMIVADAHRRRGVAKVFDASAFLAGEDRRLRRLRHSCQPRTSEPRPGSGSGRCRVVSRAHEGCVRCLTMGFDPSKARHKGQSCWPNRPPQGAHSRLTPRKGV